METREKLALLLLADAVASELEDTKSSLLKEVIRPQEDIVGNVESLINTHHLPMKAFLPMNHIKKVEEAYNETPWAKFMTFEELIENHESAAGHLVLNSVGQGVDIEDDEEFEQFKEDNNLKDFTWNCYQESPHAEAQHLVDAIYRAMI